MTDPVERFPVGARVRVRSHVFDVGNTIIYGRLGRVVRSRGGGQFLDVVLDDFPHYGEGAFRPDELELVEGA